MLNMGALRLEISKKVSWKTARLSNIFFVVFVDMVGFGLILPLLPYYAETFSATPLIIGLLVASFAAASLLGAPLMGRLSDRYGRRPMLLLSIAGTFIGYLFLGFAQPIGHLIANLFASHAVNAFTIGTLFFSRIIDGFTGGNITIAQAYISDVTDETNRSHGLGVIGSAFGLGYIIGPALGGLLSRWGYSDPAFAAASLAFLNLLTIFFFLPESLTDEHRAAIMHQQRPSLTFKALMSALNRPKVGPLLLVRFFIMLAYAIFWSVFGLFTQRKLNLSAQSTGFLMTYIGLYSVLVQAVGIRLLTKRFKDNTIIKTSLWLMFLGLVGWSLTSNLLVMLLVILPLSGGGWTLNTIITSAITKTVDPAEIGGTLGISSALESITRVIAPTTGSFMLGNIGPWAPGVVGASVLLWAIWLAYRRIVLVKASIEPLPAEPSCA
jgi:DHA1 family tetracycline resistance protein-like MFS transporter